MPFNLLDFVRSPHPRVLATRALHDAQRKKLEASIHREYYAAMEAMLSKRVARLEVEVAELSGEDKKDAA